LVGDQMAHTLVNSIPSRAMLMLTGMRPNKIAVIGLGAIGYGIATSLVRRGWPVVGADTNPWAATRFAEGFGNATGSLQEAASGAEVVILVLVNAAQCEAVLFGDAGVLAATAPDALIISCVTMDPAQARSMGERIEAAGRAFVDAPTSGGPARAAEGALTLLTSGREDAMKRAEPIFEAIASKVYRLGGEAGAGSAFKMINQLLAGIHIAAACEAIAFAKKLGLDLSKVYEVITASAGNSWMFENRVPHILDNDYAPKSAVNIFTKDLGIVSDMARAASFPTPLAASALQMFLMTAASGMARDDDASVARLYAKIGGVELNAGARSSARSEEALG
jgi:3-hydroxyisobutyrate dehydrogenase